MNCTLLCTILAILGITIIQETDTQETNAFEVGLDYGYKSVENARTQVLTEPENKYDSLKYALYTRRNPKVACFVEPTPEDFDKCSFNPHHKTQFLIHGFVEILQPGNLFEELRDVVLDDIDSNIIIVNWTLYNNIPLSKAISNMPKVGKKVAEMIYFMMNHTRVDPRMLHCIGHSLGAHVCGLTARRIINFSRVTGLDPGGINLARLYRTDIILKHTDADYVDVMHTSFIESGLGFGTLQPIGDMDFYVNGGVVQKYCKFGREYRVFKGEVLKVYTYVDEVFCNHFISLEYYINSVRDDCEFLAVKCDGFVRDTLNPVANLCPSNSNVTAKMGFHSEKIPGLPPKSAFYVDTLEFPPFCKIKEQK